MYARFVSLTLIKSNFLFHPHYPWFSWAIIGRFRLFFSSIQVKPSGYFKKFVMQQLLVAISNIHPLVEYTLNREMGSESQIQEYFPTHTSPVVLFLYLLPG